MASVSSSERTLNRNPACGMSQRDIAEQIKSLYDVDISPELVSKISEKIMPEVNQWQSRPLEPIYPFVFMDAIHYKVKENNQYVNKAAYVVLGITLEGSNDILGIWIGEHESSKFWLNVLTELKSRGVQDVYLFCVDGLRGFQEAMATEGTVLAVAETFHFCREFKNMYGLSPFQYKKSLLSRK